MKNILLIAALLLSAATARGQLAAFPGAQGGGALSLGGRGGRPIEVTNLNDSGAGSLRNCVQSSGPRTCIFRVAGRITPLSDMTITNPYLTVPCQTAPGEIIIGGPTGNAFSFRVSTHDTIVRYCTFSPDDPNEVSGPATGTTGYTIVNAVDNYNHMMDHCTFRWAGNKSWLALANFDPESFHDFTMQWSMEYEPHQGHPVGPSSSTNGSPTRNAMNTNNDFHHNLWANIDHRIPEYNNKSGRFVNIITYNYSWYANEALGGVNIDLIGNIWDYNNLVPSQAYPIHASTGVGNTEGDIATPPSMYVSGNIGHGRVTPNPNQYADLTRAICNSGTTSSCSGGENAPEIGAWPSSWIRSSPLAPSNAFPIIADDATQLWNILKPTVGNSQHLDCHGNWVSHRDNADTRIVNEVDTHGTGGFWPNGVTYIGVPYCPPGPVVGGCIPTPPIQAAYTDQPVVGFPLCTESLHDGIPDQWKTDKGLSTTDANLYKTNAPNGYTYLENYLNGSGSNVTPPPPSGRPLAPTSLVATPH